MPIECEAEESGEHGGLWKARVKAFPLATGYGYSETEACRAACDAIISAANADLTRLRAENGALAGKLAQAEADKARLAGALGDIKVHSSPGQKHFHASVLVARDAWDRAMDVTALAPSEALEAVRKALGRLREIQAMSHDMNAKADAEEAERELRAAFHLEPKP